MKKTAFLLSAALLLAPGSTFAFKSGANENCSKCHSIKKDEAETILKNLIPNVKVLDIKQAPSKSLWEIDIDNEGKKGIVYIDLTKRHVFSGSIIDVAEKRNLTSERMTEIARVDVSKIPTKDAIVIGDPKAPKKVIVFTDPDCPFCAKLHPELKKITAERKDIAFLVKMFPLPMHKEAYDKAKAIVCEKSGALLDAAFQKKPLPKPSCKTTVIDDNLALAKKLGITGAPAMVLPDGRLLPGYRDADTIKKMIDKK